METRTYTVYKFNELPEKAKAKALEKHYDINVSFDWWESTYEDAANIGLKITAFDTGRSDSCEGEFIDGAFNCANKIIAEHGETCETYKTAKEFLDGWEKLPQPEDDDARADDADALEAEFLQSLLRNYLTMLRKEYEYQTTEEAIIETFEANDYDFTEDGKID